MHLIAPLQDCLSGNDILKMAKTLFQKYWFSELAYPFSFFFYLGRLLRHLDAEFEFLGQYCFVRVRISMSLSQKVP
jgi:hypothetical protein